MRANQHFCFGFYANQIIYCLAFQVLTFSINKILIPLHCLRFFLHYYLSFYLVFQTMWTPFFSNNKIYEEIF